MRARGSSTPGAVRPASSRCSAASRAFPRCAIAAALTLIAAVVTTACGDPPDRGTDDRATAGAPGTGITATPSTDSIAKSRAATPPPDSAPPLPGILFDPATIHEGDRVGDFRVARVAITDAGGDIGRVGTVRFIGEATISGELRPHPDYPDVTTICMDVDSASAARLPRWPLDTRTRSWLCFENQEQALRMLGPAGEQKPVSVVIDTYQTPREFSDVYNTARLVRVTAPTTP